MENTEISQDASAEPVKQPARPLLRDTFDWVLVLSGLAMLPMAFLHFYDLWQRSDLKFFPLLLALTLGLMLWKRKLSSHNRRGRSIAAIACVAVALLLAVLSAVIFSPWLGLLTLLLVLIAWMLERLGEEKWYAIVSWTIPIIVILLFPISYFTDLTTSLEKSVAWSSGVVLDVLGIPQLVTNSTLELRSGIVSASLVCRGLGSPYLLLSAAVVMTMLTARSFAGGLLTLLTIPGWAWASAVLQLTLGVYLLEEHDIVTLAGRRVALVQLVALLTTLIAIWLFQLAVRELLSAFTNYSTNSTDVHKLFNKVVLWPAKDPLRKRKAFEEEVKPKSSLMVHKLFGRLVLAAALGLSIAGGFATYRMFVGQEISIALAKAGSPEQFAGEFTSASLPQQLGTMRLAGFESMERGRWQYSRRHAAEWLYVVDLKRAHITLDLPARGFYPVENEYINEVSRPLSPRTAMSAELDGVGQILVDEVMLLDELYGRSYLCYATIPYADQPPFRTSSTERAFSTELIGSAVALQPSVASVRLYIEGVDRLTDEERAEYRAILLSACEQLVVPIRAFSGQEAKPLASEAVSERVAQSDE